MATRDNVGNISRREAATPGPYVFVSERGAPLSVAGYQRMVARAGESAKFGFLVHSHMLRHSCGYKLANDGQDTRAIQHYLGHRSIASTVRYTALAPDRFRGFWKVRPRAEGSSASFASRSDYLRQLDADDFFTTRQLSASVRTLRTPTHAEAAPIRAEGGPLYRSAEMTPNQRCQPYLLRGLRPCWCG
jgi:hypothetical protein